MKKFKGVNEMEIKTVVVRGIEYKVRKLQNSAWYDLRDKSKLPDGKLSELMLYRNLLSRMVISPKKNINDFESVNEIEELMCELILYQQKETKEKTFNDQIIELSKQMIEQIEKLNVKLGENKMGYFILFVVVFVVATLIKGKIDKKKRSQQPYITTEEIAKDMADIESTQDEYEKQGKIAQWNKKMEEKTAWLEADTKRMQAERARRKAAKEAEKQAKIEFKNRNK